MMALPSFIIDLAHVSSIQPLDSLSHHLKYHDKDALPFYPKIQVLSRFSFSHSHTSSDDRLLGRCLLDAI